MNCMDKLSKIVLPKESHKKHGALEGSPSISMNKIGKTDQIIVILNPIDFCSIFIMRIL